MKHKEIVLMPSSDWVLDVIYKRRKEDISKFLHEHYGADKEYYRNNLDGYNFVTAINSTDKSKCKGHTRILMILSSQDLNTLVHELLHVLYQMESLIGVEINKKSQEWQACAIENIFKEIRNKKGWNERR